MYCPKCSQIQTEDGLRFCSRCGFQLGVVKELLAEPGGAPVMPAESQAPPKFFSRRKQDLLLAQRLCLPLRRWWCGLAGLRLKRRSFFPCG